MSPVQSLISQADHAYTQLLLHYEKGLMAHANEISSTGYPATAARIKKPCKDLLDNWKKFIEPLRDNSPSEEQINHIQGFADTMTNFLHVAYDTVLVETSKNEEDELRQEIREIIQSIQEMIGRVQKTDFLSADIMHFETLCTSVSTAETFGGLENIKMRLMHLRDRYTLL
jgi:hypothetical protein